MKRFLNLNDLSLPILKAILIIGLGIPVGFYLSSRLLDLFGVHFPLLVQLIRVFLEIGALLLLLFFVLVVAELIQDHFLYKRYLRERGKQIQTECPYCGNRQIRSFEHFCPVCGEKITPRR